MQTAEHLTIARFLRARGDRVPARGRAVKGNEQRGRMMHLDGLEWRARRDYVVWGRRGVGNLCLQWCGVSSCGIRWDGMGRSLTARRAARRTARSSARLPLSKYSQ